MQARILTVLAIAAALAACGKSGGTATTAPGPGDRISQDAKALGHDIKDAATQAAADAKPALQEAKDKGQALIHDEAQKVADWTATQPATGPSTMPR